MDDAPERCRRGRDETSTDAILDSLTFLVAGNLPSAESPTTPVEPESEPEPPLVPPEPPEPPPPDPEADDPEPESPEYEYEALSLLLSSSSVVTNSTEPEKSEPEAGVKKHVAAFYLNYISRAIENE